MKTAKKILLLGLLSANLGAAPMQDDGSLKSTWFPEELDSFRQSPDIQTAFVVAKYSPATDTQYVVIDANTNQGRVISYFKIQNGQATPLGSKRDTYPTPFGEFIQDPQIINHLWNDYLARWTKSFGKDIIQQRINLTQNDIIYQEEVDHFKAAGFKIPPGAHILSKRGDPIPILSLSPPNPSPPKKP